MIDSTKYINIFIDHQRPEIKQVTILRKVRVLRFLFEYLELIDIQDLYDVTKMNVYDFLHFPAPSLRGHKYITKLKSTKTIVCLSI